MSFGFALAGPDDDAQIADLLAQSELPGWISLSYRVAPGAHGLPHPRAVNQTLIARQDDGALAGMVTRSTFPAFLKGRPKDVSYLGHFRVAPAFRRHSKLLRRAFDEFRAHLDTGDWSFASLLDDNRAAHRLLTSGLPGFPTFTQLGRYQTTVFRSKATRADPAITAAKPDEMDEVISAYTRMAQHHPLAPVLTPGDFTTDAWPNLKPSDFLVARSAGQIVGLVALWDQRVVRQMQVTGYERRVSLMRPFINALGRVTSLPRLPPVGEHLKVANLSFLATDDPSGKVALALIGAARALAFERGLDGVALGLAVADPLLEQVRQNLRGASYGSCIYGVTWQGKANSPPPSDFAGMRPDIGLL
jgi:hypothetical protein